MAKDKSIFYALNECSTKQIFVGEDIYLSVAGSRIVQLNDGHFDDVLCVRNISCNLLSLYQISHSSEGKIIEVLPHKVVIKDLKHPKHFLEIIIVYDITML